MAAMVAGPFPALTSAGGVIALLDEPAADLQTRALERLNDMVHEFWPEISGSIGKIEELFEDESFQSQKLAALVASKVFYHLGEYDDALTFALGASELFDVAEESQYVNTMISKCIDKYIQLSITEGAEIGARLMDIVDRMFQNCFDQGNYKQAVGIGLEARNLQRVEQAIRLSNDMAPMLNYCYEVIQSVAMTLAFRRESLQLLVSLYKEVGGSSSSGVDYFAICQCLLLLKDHESVAEILAKLARGSLDDTLLAYQVAFDLSDNGAHHFMERVSATLPVPAAPAAEAGADAAAAPDAMDTDADSEFTPELTERLNKLRQILSSETLVRLHLEFMFRNNNTDMLLLKQIKDSIEARNSIGHNATVFANAIMHCGTTVDSFLRENIDWLKRSTNWAKFSATACVGTIHKGHISKGMAVLRDYLPGSGATGGSPYLEGGALYALGVINAGHGESVKPFLVEQLEGAGGTGAEVLHHGACLGLGLASMASGDSALAQQIMDTVLLKWLNTISGEAAGYAIGLIMLGCGQSQLLEDLMEFAKECAHEKVVRGVAMGMAMMVFGCEEDAETLIEQMAREADHILRYGAMFATGLAYAGTSNNNAISRLLHVAVSDVSELSVLCITRDEDNSPIAMQMVGHDQVFIHTSHDLVLKSAISHHNHNRSRHFVAFLSHFILRISEVSHPLGISFYLATLSKTVRQKLGNQVSSNFFQPVAYYSNKVSVN
jgi:26S proteasome regulatory subunit N2